MPGRLRRSTWLMLALALLLPACDTGARLSVVSGGVERSATIDRPASRGGPRPLLVVLHPATLSGEATRSELAMAERAGRAGVVVVFPDAEGPFWNDGSLSLALPRMFSGEHDLGFLDALIAALVANGTADPAAVHIAGISNGGMMAMHYACQRAGRIASVAVFMATMPLESERECHPARPLNVLMVAGTEDPVVRWTGEVTLGGLATLQQRMSVPESFAFWRRANGCAGLAPARALPRRGALSEPQMHLHAATGCAGGVSTLLYEVRGGGHILPGSDAWPSFWLLGRATPDIEAADLLLAFVLDPGRMPGLQPPAGPGGRVAGVELRRGTGRDGGRDRD